MIVFSVTVHVVLPAVSNSPACLFMGYITSFDRIK